MTLRLSRHQRLELCRLRSGHLLLLCWTLAPVRWPTKRVSAGWIGRIVGEWSTWSGRQQQADAPECWALWSGC
jgi:hypothetical protein